MHSFRDFVNRHFSHHSLHALLGASFIGLGLLGQSYIQEVDTIFDEITWNMAPSLSFAGLSEKLPKLPKTPPPSLEIPDRSLALGESSQEVLLLQEFLKWRGFWPEGEEITGYFGEMTLRELKRYQRAVGIPGDGIAGPLTRAAWQWDTENSL